MGYLNQKFSNSSGLAGAFFILTLSACSSGSGGGGNGGSGNTGLTYTGNTSPAQISAVNAGDTTDLVITGDDSTVIFTAANTNDNTIDHQIEKPGSSPSAELFSYLRNQFIDLAKSNIKPTNPNRYTPSTINVNETENCDSGTISASGQLNDDATGTLTLSFNNCQVEDFTANGQVDVEVISFDLATDIPTNTTLTFTNLQVSATDFNLVTAGSISFMIDTATNVETLTLNIIAEEQGSGEQFQAENVVIETTFDDVIFPSSYSQTIRGRYYDSVEGYVDVETVVPASYSNLLIDYPDSGGEIIITGANLSKIRVIANPDNTVTLELDLDGDDTYELSATLQWSELETEDGSSFS